MSNWTRKVLAALLVSAPSAAIVACTNNSGGSADSTKTHAPSAAAEQDTTPPVKRMASAFDTTQAGLKAAGDYIKTLGAPSNPHRVQIWSDGCNQYVTLVFSTFKGAGKLKASDYASSFGVGLGQIENTSQTCTPNGLHVPAGKTATWLVSGGTAYFVVFDAGNTTQIGWGEMSACKGKHTPMGDHSTAKVVFDTCDHVEPTEAAVSVSQSTPASGQADIPSIKGAYTTWVNCSDTCCYVDPGYPLTEAFHSRGPAARPPGSEKKKV